ncbi:MAG: hypothetical protein ABIG44_16785 [Planctomycetota bacterium]
MDNDIDIMQLPIPNWGIGCPNCRYPLRGLPTHRCPECGTDLDMGSIVHTWMRLRPPRFTGDESPLPDFGFYCPYCETDLAGAINHTCPQCGKPFDISGRLPRHDWFILDRIMCGEVPVPGMQSVLEAELVPHFPVEERTIGELVGGHGSLFNRLRVASEFYLEVRWLLQHARHEMDVARAAGGLNDWTCPKCHEENPGNFDLCWNCGEVQSNE